MSKRQRGPLPSINENIPTPCHIIVQFAKLRSKDTILKVARGKRILTYRGRNIRIMSDLSTETWQLGRVGRVFSKLYLRRTCS